MNKPNPSWKRAYAIFLLCAATAIALPGQTFTTLHSFHGTDGALPSAGLIQATDGNLYGTATYGGTGDGGTVFKLLPAACSRGFTPFAPKASARMVKARRRDWCRLAITCTGQRLLAGSSVAMALSLGSL